MSLLFNMLSRLVITFLPRSKCLLISWLQSPSAQILEPRKRKSATLSTVYPSVCDEVMRPVAMIFIFWIWTLTQHFYSPLSLSSRGSLVLLHLENPIGRNWCILTFTSPVRTGTYGGFWVSRGGQATLGKQIQEINCLQRSQRIWIWISKAPAFCCDCFPHSK